MQLSSILHHLESLAPLAYAEDFDNVGLLTSHQNEITGIIVAHDALEEVIDEAIEKKCNLVNSFSKSYSDWRSLVSCNLRN